MYLCDFKYVFFVGMVWIVKMESDPFYPLPRSYTSEAYVLRAGGRLGESCSPPRLSEIPPIFSGEGGGRVGAIRSQKYL